MNYVAALLIVPSVLAADNDPADTSLSGGAPPGDDSELAFAVFARMMQATGLRRVFDTKDDLLSVRCLPPLRAHVAGAHAPTLSLPGMLAPRTTARKEETREPSGERWADYPSRIQGTPPSFAFSSLFLSLFFFKTKATRRFCLSA